MERTIQDGLHKLKFKPLYTDKEFVYEIERPSEEYKPVFFKTATTGMQLVEVSGKLFVEHLRVDGNLELIPYKGVHAGNDNFVNIGWQKDSVKKYLRIDVYTGESLLIGS